MAARADYPTPDGIRSELGTNRRSGPCRVPVRCARCGRRIFVSERQRSLIVQSEGDAVATCHGCAIIAARRQGVLIGRDLDHPAITYVLPLGPEERG